NIRGKNTRKNTIRKNRVVSSKKNRLNKKVARRAINKNIRGKNTRKNTIKKNRVVSSKKIN
ncbi:hypothetical protein G8V02_14515, partial [Clostridium botulinum D/C]